MIKNLTKTVDMQCALFNGFQGVVGSAYYVPLVEPGEGFVMPESVTIELEHLGNIKPTSFDKYGNPRIDGIADTILCWKIRQLVRDGTIDSQYYNLKAICTYDLILHPNYIVPLRHRLVQMEQCPVCGKDITLEQVDNRGLTSDEGRLFHKVCYLKYLRLQMTDELTELVALAFSDFDLKWKETMSCEVVTNEYCSEPGCCGHRPWFMFTTPYGRIKIGWRKRVINIEFYDFKGVDYYSLFAEENVTKGYFVKNENNYYIHAWGKDEAWRYLSAVTQKLKAKLKIK